MDKIHKTIQNVFHSKHYQIVKIDKGISNHNYLLTLGNHRYIVRAPKINHHKLGLQFEKENTIIPLVTDLDVPTVFFDEQRGIKITSFIPDCLEFQETKDPQKYQKTAFLLSQLHEKKIQVPFYFDPFAKLAHYKNLIHTPFIDFSKEEVIIDAAKRMYHPDRVCHNDVVSGNLLFSKEREYLIDWEYGAMNDIRFDIASFFSENQITDTSFRKAFYDAYTLPVKNEDVLLFEALEDILWGYWANMLWEQREEEIYKIIAWEKEKHYHTFAAAELYIL